VDIDQHLGGTMNIVLVSVAILLTAVSGVPGALMSRRSRNGERLAVALMFAGGAAGTFGALAAAATSATATASFPWRVPGGAIALRLDPVAAMFLAQIFLIAPLVSIYGMGYWPQRDRPENARKLRLFLGLLTGSMGLLVLAQNAMLFLLGWEGMALAAFLVVTTDDRDEAVQRAGFVYLVATRIGTLALFAMFAVLHAASGDWSFAAPAHTTEGFRTAIFLLALFGCALKGGVMPMHVWLPGAHANAPSHVSAFMSGVLIKMGIYGVVRVTSFFEGPPVWWGGLIFALGVVSGVLGVAFAIGQHDLKRLLAYHSVENIGIILMGLGLAVIGRAVGRPEIVALGLAGSLLHVWNHGLFKALLFFSAGSVVHATHTREIDELGGVARKMPRTTVGFLVGAIAICGLPPFNGFVSELFIYLGLFRAVILDVRGLWIAGAFGIPALALIGALALACFVKVFGAVFLGAPRSERVAAAHEQGGAMTTPMLVLGACCAFIGLLPIVVAPVLDHATRVWAPEVMNAEPSVAARAPLLWVSVGGAALVVATIAGALATARLAVPARAMTWDCGYVAPSARMQYTSSSFARSLVRWFSWALRPHVERVALQQLFPTRASFNSHVPDTILERGVLPGLHRTRRLLAWFRWMQQGNVHLYVLYIVITLLVTILFRR
jgi:hydrogenase-4 component B